MDERDIIGTLLMMGTFYFASKKEIIYCIGCIALLLILLVRY